VARALKSAPTAIRIVCHPLTPARWDDFVKLFGPRGACAGCWCMWPRETAAEFTRLHGPGNRRRMRGLVARGQPIGVIAYVAGEPAGWCAVAPRAAYTRLARSRILQPVDDLPTWATPCFFIARPHRGRGLTTRLLEAAVGWAASQGAARVEGYPVEPRKGRMPDAWAWFGLASAFRAAGFREVARRSPTRPIMRREIGRAKRGAGLPAASRPRARVAASPVRGAARTPSAPRSRRSATRRSARG
jgi:GNAT superfamily N-acetyltransferase